MNRFYSLVGGFLAVVVIFCAGAASQRTGHLEADSLTVRSITVKAPDGKYSVAISAGETSSGVWVTGPDAKKYACMYSGGVAMAPYVLVSNGHGANNSAAIGPGCLQLGDKTAANASGRVDVYHAADLRRVLGGDFTKQTH